LIVGIPSVELSTGGSVGVSSVRVGAGVVAVADGRKSRSMSHVASDHGGRTSRKVVVVAKLVVEESSRTTELGSIEMLFFRVALTDSTDDECNDDCNDKDSSNCTKDGTDD
jgi:uncharacterized protein YfaQ (DUF2300 family)